MPIKSGFYKGRLGIGLDTTDNAYTSGSDTGVPLYPLDINGDIRITGCIVNKNGDSINLSTTIMALMQTDTNLSKIDSTVNFNILSTGHLKLPAGTTAQRTSPGVLGMLRYNTTTNSFEGYGAGNAWGSLGGVMDIDQDTYITAEQSSDEDKLRFYTGGNEKMLIQNTTNDGIIIKSSIVPDTDSTFDIGSASKKIRHMYISSSSLWIGDDHRISIDNDGTMKFKKRNKNVVPKGLRDALGLDSTAALTKVKADLGVTDISTLKLNDWLSYSRTHATGMANADIKDIFKNEDNEDYEQIDGTVTTVGELNQITNVNTDTKAQGQPLVWNGGTWSASSDIYIYNGKVGIGTASPSAKLDVNGNAIIRDHFEIYKTGGSKITHFNWGANGDIYLRSSETAGKIILQDDGGNVGIGTGSPASILHIVDSDHAKVNIWTTTVGKEAQIRMSGGNNSSSEPMLYVGAGTVAGAKACYVTSRYDHPLCFQENNVEVMRLHTNGNIGIGTTSPTEKLEVAGNIKTSANVTAHTVSAQNYAVGGTNFISASRQGNFRDLEVKDNANNATILLSGGTSGVSGGDISITGTLSTDTISEKTSGTGVTIDSVLLKDQNVTAHTVTATNYAVGNVNFISASRQGNFRDLEVKNSSNTATILLTGDGGTVSATKFIGDGSELTGVATSGGGSGFNWTAQDGTKNISDLDLYHGYQITASNTAAWYIPENAFRGDHGYDAGPAHSAWITESTKYNTTTGIQTGNVDTSGYKGEWIQINFGKKVKVYHFGIRGAERGETNYNNASPGKYKLFGSNDGSNWTDVHTGSSVASDYGTNFQLSRRETLSTPATYQYFRLVVNETIGGNGRVMIEYLSFYGAFPEQVDKVAVVSGTNMLHKSDDVYKNVSLTYSSILDYEYQEMRMVITPTATDSVIELKYNIFGDINENVCFRITRNINGTDVSVVPAPSSDKGILAVGYYDEGGDTNSTPSIHPISWYDEPNTTSTVTYKLWIGISSNLQSSTVSGLCHLNRAGNTHATHTYFEYGVSTAAAIEHPKPQQSLTTVTNASQVEGQVLETLAGICDGRSVTVSSGTYTLGNVTTYQDLTTTYALITGSNVNYKPPVGTKQVIYKLFVQCFGVDPSSDSGSGNIMNHVIRLDGNEITSSKSTHRPGGANTDDTCCITYVINIGNEDDLVNGKISSWDTLKTIEVYAREWSSNHEMKLHGVHVLDGQNNATNPLNFYKPRIEIQAIGTAQYDVVQRVVTYKDGQVLETLAGKADGSTITVSSGTYTMPISTNALGSIIGTTYIKETASEITYKAPAGTERIIFQFTGIYNYRDTAGMLEGKFYVDDVEFPGAGTLGHFRHRGGSGPVGPIPFPKMIIKSSEYDLSVPHKYYWNIKALTSSHELYYGFEIDNYTNYDEDTQEIKITAIGRQVAPASAADFKIQKVDTISTPPNNGNMLTWDAAKGRWKPSEFIVENNDGTKNISDLNLYHGYQVSTSSVVDDQTTAEDAFRKTEAYNHSNVKKSAWESAENTYSTSGDYTGSQTTNGYVGEWIQINFNKKVKVYHYHITPIAPRTSTYERYKRAPKEYKVFGSNDGTTWVEVHSGTATTKDYTGSETPTDDQKNRQFVKTNTLSTPATYQYFRLVINKTLGAPSRTAVGLSYLAFYGNFPNERIQTLPVSGSNVVTRYFSTQQSINVPHALPGYHISELDLTITPSATDSVIELKFNLFAELNENVCFRIKRNNDFVVPATSGTGALTVVISDKHEEGNTPITNIVRWYDEPNTTNTITYKLYINTSEAAHNNEGGWINRSKNDSSTYDEKGVSTSIAIEHPKPQSVMSSVNNSTAVEGQVLETLAGVCDGRSVTVSSGTYSLENVTAEQDVNASSYGKANGSFISYKPPHGTKQVIYNYYVYITFKDAYQYSDKLCHKIKLDGQFVGDSNVTYRGAGKYGHEEICISYVFDIGEDDIEFGKIPNWDTNKSIEVYVRDYNSGSETMLHRLRYLDGSEGDKGLVKPRIEITAIGRAQYDVVQRVVNYKDGQLLETLSGKCKGQSITVSSGTYTLENPTADFSLTDGTTWKDLTGSKINYKPPTGTKQVIYEFSYHHSGDGGSADLHIYRLSIDGTSITNEKGTFRTGGGSQYDNFSTVRFVIDINGIDDLQNNSVSSWNTLKELKMEVSGYSTSYVVNIHRVVHFENGNGSYNGFHGPTLKIQAIGRALAPVGNFKIQDVDTITTPPTDGQALVWDNTNKHWKAGAGGGGGGGGGVQTLSSQPTIANSTAGQLYYDTSWKSFFGRMESKWMEMMLEGTPLLFGHPSKIIPKNGANIVETTATTIEFTWVNPPQYRSCMSAKNTADYVDAINATNHTSGELYLPAINDIWFQYGSNTYKVGGKNITGASGNTAQSLSNISGPKKLTNKVVIITTGSSVPSYASSWTPSTSTSGEHYIGLDDNGNQTFIFNPNNTTWSLTASTNYNFKVWLENSTPNQLPPQVSHDSTSTADGTSNLVDSRNFSNHDGISTLQILPPTQIYVADNKLTNGFHVTLTRNGNTHYLTCIIPPEALTGTYNGTDDVKVTTTGDINAMDSVVYYKGFEVQYQTAVASDNFDKATSAIVWTGNWTNAVFSSTSTTNQTGTTFSTDADATNRIAAFTPLKPTSTIVASGAGTTPTKNDFTVKKSFTLVQNDNKFYKFRVRAFNQVQTSINDSVWSEKEYVIRFNKPETVTWKGTAAPHLPKFTTKTTEKLHWYITLNWNQQNIKSSVASGNDGTIDEYAHSDLKIHEYKLQRSQDGDTTWETVAYWILPDDNAQMETYDYRIHPPHDDRGETETSNDGNNTKTQEARLLAGTRAPQYSFKLQARNWLFGTGIDTGSIPGPRTNYQWARASVTDNRWSAESVSSKTTYSTALIPVAPPKPVIHDNSDDKYAIKFYEMNTTDTKSPWKDGRIASDTDFNAVVDSSLVAARTKEATLQNETPDQDYISYQWKLPYPSEAFKDTLGSSVDRYEIKLESNKGPPSTVIAHEVEKTGETVGLIWGWPTGKYVYYFTGTRALSLSGVFEQKNGSNYYWLVKNPLPNGITRVWITLIWSGNAAYHGAWGSGIGISWRPHNGVGTTAGSISPNSYSQDTWSSPTPDLLPGTEIGIGGGGGINFGLRIYTYSPNSIAPYHTQEIYANDFNYGAANWYLQEYSTNALLDQPLNYKVKGYNFFVTNPSDYSDPLGTALTSDKPSAPQFLSTAADANKDNSNPTFTLTNHGLTLLVDEPQYTSVDANGNANNFQLESLTIQEFQIQPNIDNSDADKTLVQDNVITKRGLNLPLEFPEGSTFHTSQAAVHSLDPGDNVWMYLADGTLVAKLTIKQDVQNGWNFEPYNNQEVGSGYSGYLSLQMDRLKASVEYVGGVWPTGLSSQANVWLKYTDDNGLGGGEVGWYLRSKPAKNKLVSQGKDVVASFFHPVSFPLFPGIIDTEAKLQAIQPGDYIWMYLGNGTLVGKLPVQSINIHGNIVLSGPTAYSSISWGGSNNSNRLMFAPQYLKESVEQEGGTWPSGFTISDGQYYNYTDDNGLGGGEVGWYLRTQEKTNSSGTTALDEMTGGVVKYKVKAKNVLNSTFSDEAEATLTIGKPNPGTNFKFSPKFTWVQATNKIKLEFFRKYSSTDILFDGSSSTNAPISAVTANCNVTNEIKTLKWNVKCSGATGGTITTSYADVGDTTGYIDSGDNSTSTAAYTISDTGVEHWAKGTDHHVRYRVKNQYHADWFEDPAASLYCQIKLTAPNTIGGISSVVTYAFASGSNNQLQINWTKPTEYGLHYKHQGSGSIVAQSNQPNIKTYKVYFNDGTLYYVFTRTATNQADVSDDATITSGSTVEKWTNSSRNSGYEASYSIRIKAGKTYVVEKITAINWLYDYESPAQSSSTSTTYSNGNQNYPPTNGSTTITSGNAPIPTPFSNYTNQGILIASGSTVRTVKKIGATNDGTALTNVLLNALASTDTTSTMGIKITISGGVTGETSECKFNSNGIVSGNSLTLTYSGSNIATITVGSYSDLYNGATSSTDNLGYWFINSSIKLKWHADASNISAFYGKNLTFNVVVTYYGNSNSVLTRQIETGYYDKTIANPSVTTITPAYTPYTCCGLPILHSTDTLTVATVFNNQSTTWVASSAVNTITLGGSVASVTTSKSNHTYSGSTVSLAATDMGSYSGTSLVKDAQITVVAKNCNGTGSLTHSSKYIYDPKTLALITTIAGQSLTTDHISVASGGETGNASAGVVKMNVLNVPDNFHPTDKVSFTPALLDVTSATVNGKNRLIIYNGKFCSAAYFNQEFGTTYTGYHADVATIGGTQTTTASAGGAFYGAGGAVTTTLENDFRWQIFGMRYKNTSGGGVPITTCEISLGSSSETNITENHLKKYTTNGSSYTHTADSSSDVEFWVKVKIAAGDGLSAYESRWNKLIQNNTNYIGASHGSINNKYDETDSSKDRTSSWVGGTLSGSNNNIKLAIRQGSTAFTTPWDIFIAVGMRNNSNVKTFIEVPKTIGKLTSGS
jgi:hypothetical protein